jgi:hypothetical protein
MNNKYYYINNTCDIDDIKIAGEILVVLDNKLNPIWYYDLSDADVDLEESTPKDLFKLTNSIEYECLGYGDPELTKSVCLNIQNWLIKQGCEFYDESLDESLDD